MAKRWATRRLPFLFRRIRVPVHAAAVLELIAGGHITPFETGLALSHWALSAVSAGGPGLRVSLSLCCLLAARLWGWPRSRAFRDLGPFRRFDTPLMSC